MELNKLKKYWDQLIHIGVDKSELSNHREVVLLNSIIFYSCTFALGLAITDVIYVRWELVLIDIEILIIVSSVLYINYKKRYQLARNVFFVSGSIALALIGWIVGGKTNSSLFFINLMVAALMLYKNKKQAAPILILCVLGYLAHSYLSKNVEPIIPLDESILKPISKAFLYTFLGILLMQVLHFKDLSNFFEEEVKEKNQEITDSITYAKRIQSAILPSNHLVNESLPNSFVLYLPKDIVAGDFYWLEKIGSSTLFAVADCTGHGVPGAMVSVVCNNALNRSVREYGLTILGEILDKTREIVLDELSKNNEDVKDGMDIALCRLNGNTLEYAGANNPLWIVRNGELLETKPNKQPIGKFDNPIPFTNHTIELQKGDSIYIFSDGYIDQFGGEKDKKFGSKRLKNLFLSIQEKSMEEQKNILTYTLSDWMNISNAEQLDDICIMGIKI